MRDRFPRGSKPACAKFLESSQEKHDSEYLSIISRGPNTCFQMYLTDLSNEMKHRVKCPKPNRKVSFVDFLVRKYVFPWWFLVGGALVMCVWSVVRRSLN